MCDYKKLTKHREMEEMWGKCYNTCRKQITKWWDELGDWDWHISIITLSVNELNYPTKTHRVAEWKKAKTLLYAAYKRFISEVKTHTGWKWRYRKRYFIQMKPK